MSIDHKNIEKLESKAPWRETKKKKTPVPKMSRNLKTYLPYLNYTPFPLHSLSPLHSEPFPYVSKAFQFVT